jgi:alanine dehydrogenase
MSSQARWIFDCHERILRGIHMRIGVPKEIKTQEFRVGMTPSGAAMLTARGHTVLVEQGAGLGSSIPDEAYVKAGAKIVSTRDEVWGADMVVKVKEPIAPEFALMRKDLLLFTYLHLAAAQELGKELLNRGVNGVAYETIEPSPGDLPLLTPMSAVAGRMSVQAGATYLERERGGKGVLLGGVPGVQRGRVTVIGGGVVGANAVKMAVGLGANVTVLDVNLKTLAYLDDIYAGRVSTQFSDPISIERAVLESDLVIGAVLLPGARAPRLVTEAMIKQMEPGSVIVDVSIDQGGCVEGARPTYHDNPTYDLHGVTAYMVANMPGAVPRTSTYALTNATIKYVVKLADLGLEKAIADTPHIVTGLNTYKGAVPHAAVAEALSVPYTAYRG